MKTVVFVDELLLVNFAAAAALLLGAGLLCGRSCTGLRLCAGSAAAAVSTLVLLAPPWPAPLAVLYKIASCCGVVAVCYGVSGARSFARLCGWYAALNGLLCGAVVSGTVSGYVWEDVNGDGRRDEDEPPLAGVTVSLVAEDGTQNDIRTDAQGGYSFENLRSGDYTLRKLKHSQIPRPCFIAVI